MINFYLQARSSNHVRRMHTLRVLHNETVGEHTANVICGVMAFMDFKPSQNLLMAAASHDMEEYYTGDIPANVKVASLKLKEALDHMEADWRKSLSVPDFKLKLTSEESLVLKFIDGYDLLCFCRTEEALGNRHLHPVSMRIQEYVHGTIVRMDDVMKIKAYDWMGRAQGEFSESKR